MMNISKKKVKIEKGERIAQALLVKIARPNLIEKKIRAKSRGGIWLNREVKCLKRKNIAGQAGTNIF